MNAGLPLFHATGQNANLSAQHVGHGAGGAFASFRGVVANDAATDRVSGSVKNPNGVGSGVDGAAQEFGRGLGNEWLHLAGHGMQLRDLGAAEIAE